MKKWMFILLCSYFSQSYLYAQVNMEKGTTTNSLFQKIKEDSITHIIFATDFDSLLQGRFVKNCPKLNATIVFKNANKADTMQTKISLRGKYRRRICGMPPIKLDFSKKDLANLELNPLYDELKLVTHCLEGEQSKETLLKEYWTYRLYQQITDNSFQVHLIKITYLDTKRPGKTIESLAFIIENNKELANRIGGEIVDKFGLTPSKLETNSYHYSLMFNYMIGNLDWKIAHQRNVKFIQTEEALVVVPYDFDQAALVNAPYAKPHPDYKQKKLEDRFCIGRFEDEEHLISMAAQFLKAKKSLLLFKECPYLGEKYKIKMEAYLNSFFKEIQNKRQLRKVFLSGT